MDRIEEVSNRVIRVEGHLFRLPLLGSRHQVLHFQIQLPFELRVCLGVGVGKIHLQDSKHQVEGKEGT